MPRRARAGAVVLLLGWGALACGGGEETGGDVDPQVARGQRVYQNVCIACHNGDPTADGALGPAIAGSPRALLEAKVVRGEYPEGYTPKRPGSNAMPRFEYLADEIDALTAYLAAAEDGSG